MPHVTPNQALNRPRRAPTTPFLPSTPLFEPRHPQPNITPGQLPALRDLAAFEAITRFTDSRIKNYIAFPRSNYVAMPSEAAIGELQEVGGLSANSADARIAFARTAVKHLRAYQEGQAGPLHMVTISPRRYAFRVGDEGVALRHLRAPACQDGEAANFDVRRLQALARQALAGFSFVGMVEIALFKDWGPDGPCHGDWISWHMHLLVWGATRAQLQACLGPLSRREAPFLCHGSVGDLREFSPSELTAKLVYMLKPPLKHYRVSWYSYEWCSPTTGEVRAPGWRTRKDWMRTGDRVRLLDVFVGRQLNSLFFGGGTGTAVARAIRAAARRRS